MSFFLKLKSCTHYLMQNKNTQISRDMCCLCTVHHSRRIIAHCIFDWPSHTCFAFVDRARAPPSPQVLTRELDCRWHFSLRWRERWIKTMWLTCRQKNIHELRAAAESSKLFNLFILISDVVVCGGREMEKKQVWNEMKMIVDCVFLTVENENDRRTHARCALFSFQNLSTVWRHLFCFVKMSELKLKRERERRSSFSREDDENWWENNAWKKKKKVTQINIIIFRSFERHHKCPEFIDFVPFSLPYCVIQSLNRSAAALWFPFPFNKSSLSSRTLVFGASAVSSTPEKKDQNLT